MVLQLPEAEMLRRFHMSKPMLSGLCAIGWHEGTRTKDFRGTPVKVCVSWETCTCQCHVPINEMYEMAGVPRETHPNPEYKPPVRTWYMPVRGIDFGVGIDSITGQPIPTSEIERNGNGEAGRRNFAPTSSGRAAKGQLEDWVLEVCTEWAIDSGGEICTPAFVAFEIARVQDVSEPSTGAINAVFDRWMKYGFAELATKPNRFIGFTAEGREKGLDLMKALYKRSRH